MTPEPFGIGIVAASVGAGLGSLYLLRYLYGQRDRSGASWFMGNIASVAACCFAYGAALLVSAPPLRVALEAVTFVSVCFMGPFFLAFGLDYTGRGDLIRKPIFAVVGVVPVLTAGLAATNPLHRLVWADLRFDPVFGLETVAYSIQPWGAFALLFSVGTAAVGSLLLIGAVLSYGPLYRREAIAVVLSTVPPSTGVFLWLFGIGPVPQLHLTAPLMLVHVALDAYAFVGTHMFETNPATQRMAERTGLDSLSEPVFVVDAEADVVRANERAAALFPDALAADFPIPVETVFGVGLETLRATGEVTVATDESRTFGVSYTRLRDPSGTGVGGMVVLYDVTEERQREQQLTVLNRILRHNLRNETTVIGGYAELLASGLTDPRHASQAETIAAASDRLRSIAEKAREFERVQRGDVRAADVLVDELLDDVERRGSPADSGAVVERTVAPPELRVRTDPELLSMLLANLVENAIVHSDSAEPSVEVDAAAVGADVAAAVGTDDGDAVGGAPADGEEDGRVAFAVRDDNDRIPEMELDALRSGDETPLQHGQGIGLWIVYWCVKKLRGDVDFAYDDGNVVTVRVPDRGGTGRGADHGGTGRGAGRAEERDGGRRTADRSRDGASIRDDGASIRDDGASARYDSTSTS